MLGLGSQSVRSLKRIYWGAIVGAVALVVIILWINPSDWFIGAVAAIPFITLARAARRAIEESTLG